MSEGRPIRIGKAAREFNISAQTIIAFLAKKGHDIVGGLNAKLSPEQYGMLANEYESDRKVKEKAESIELAALKNKNAEKEDLKPAADVVKGENQEKPPAAIVSDDLMIKKTTMASPAPAEPKEKPVPEPKPESKSEEQAKQPVKEDVSAPPKTEISAEKAVIKDKPQEEKPEKEVVKEQPAEKKETPKEEKEEKEVTVASEKLPVEQKPEKEEKKEVVKDSAEDKNPEPKAGKASVSIRPSEDEKPSAEIKKAQQAEAKEDNGPKVLGTIDLASLNQKTKPAKKSRKERRQELEKNKNQHKQQKPADDKKKPVAQQPDKKEAVKPKEEPKAVEKKEEVDENFIPTEVKKLTGPKILDKIVLPEKKKPEKKKPVASSSGEMNKNRKKKRKRIRPNGPVNQNQQQGGQQQGGQQQGGGQQRNQDRRNQRNRPARGRKKEQPKVEPTAEEIQQKVRETLTKLTSSSKSKGSKHRRAKREQASQVRHEEMIRQEEEKKVLKVTEFVTANELATMMDVQVNNIISACMSLGLFVSINQRLDAETITVVAEEFGYTVEFVSVEVLEAIDGVEEEEEDESKLESRAPIVTVMGHVDHGKTKLLDYIRNANVVAGEAGGITQHIGAYEVTLDDGRKITFLDTPGHEAFTAMRARGAQVTDVAIIVIAADDSVMPQTKEAINHASAAGVPIVFAINKIDKPTANVERIKEQLANMNYLVEDWGGKYQSQEISAKAGINIDELLEKVLLESEMLDLKANPNRLAKGAIIESSLDKGRGYVSKMLVQSGTMHIGDTVLAGSYFGKVKAMYNQFNEQVKEAGPSTPVLMLGLNGAPGAGDAFNVMKEEREAKNIATKRLQLQREQGLRTQKHITLDEIGRRIAIGDFQELNVIVKGDVQGSVEALTDAILKLSTDEVQVNVVHQAVGQIVESDVLLASASNAVIIGFQVRPSVQARRLAEAEQIDIRLYSIIYQALEELKSAIEGLLAPKIEEKIIGNLEVREIFKISKVGTIAGCFAIDGKVQRTSKVRVIRDGIVVYTGLLGSLRRFKDDVKEVIAGQDCGMNIENFNDIKVGDIIEGYEEYEIKRKL